MGGAESEEWELKQEQQKKRRMRKMIQTSAILPISGCFIIETAEDFEWDNSVINARDCLVLSCLPIPIGSFTVSPFLVSSSHALEQFFFIILFVTSSN